MKKVIMSPSVRIVAALLGATALSGCLGSSGGAAKFTPEQFDERLEEIQAIAPSSDLERKGTASYSGAVKINGVENPKEELVGDVNLDVDFEHETVSGTASNWTGMLQDDDTGEVEEVSFDGELSTGDEFVSTVALVTFDPNDIHDLPTDVDPVTTGAVAIYMTGKLDSDDDNMALLSLNGAFVGPGGEAIHGGAGLQEISDTSVSERTGTGYWFAERD